jgi:dextranase
MHFVDLYPAKGVFTLGETVRCVAEVAGEMGEKALIQISIFHLSQAIDTLTYQISLKGGEQNFALEWQAPLATPRGYGVTAELLDPSGIIADTISTAFDILPDWTTFPRYGFLTDFSPGRTDITDTLAALMKFHINGLQFYDWQYRHDELLPPKLEYIDPLGRALSLVTVREFIQTAREYGMAAMAYLAVYAASVEFWQAHPEWALYDVHGQHITFEGFLCLMDPTLGSPWIEHLLSECRKVLAELPFNGLHVDQYGDPKVGFNADGKPVDIPAAFAAFIHTLKDIHPWAAVVFNAVGNWPIEELVAAPQDFIYIEIWPPDVYYRDIRRIITDARIMSGGKPIVIALYLPASHPENVRLADALIFSLGGSRIELGEKAQLLADPYFPKYQTLSPNLKRILRRYYDFVVRYGELLGPTAKLVDKYEVTMPPGVWACVRSLSGWLVLSLVNMSGLGDPRWNEEQSKPTPLSAVFLQMIVIQSVRQVWWASPDIAEMDLVPLSWKVDNHIVSLTLPELDHWAMIAFELETTA